MITKQAIAYESTGIVDMKNKLPIRTTARVRDAYRKMKPEEPARWYDLETGEVVDGARGRLPNYYVSQIIETEFTNSHDGVPDDGYFKLDDGSRGEIRFMISASGDFYDVFVSSIKDSSIDIISFQRGYFKKKVAATPYWYKKIKVPSWIK
jgi:hypothetical protein